MEKAPATSKTLRKRKRSGESVSDDSDDASKKRGRPRTEKADASAADRRRTQIRMAQRAYRQRKETTLDDLRKRVSDLTTTIECMNKAFEDCRDRLVGAGLPEAQLDDLSEVTVRFSDFMKTVRRPSDVQDDEAPEEVPAVAQPAPVTNGAAKRTAELPLVPKNVPSWIDKATLDHKRPDPGMGYGLYVSNSFDQLAENFSIPAMSHAMSPEAAKPSSPGIAFQNGSTNGFRQASTSLANEMPSPHTYSFQETTLARRLHRACIEGAYHLLLDPSRRPHTFDRVFKLSLLGRDKTELTASFKRALDRGLGEPLDLFEQPLVHIGGAGLHYPRRHAQINGDRKSPYHLGIIGPQMFNMLENVVQARPTVPISVEIAGYEGEWFDPYDIEGYLESKGIHIDPTQSFVEAEITGLPEDESSDSAGSSGHTSTMHTDQRGPWPDVMDTEQWSDMQMLGTDLERWQEMGSVQVNGLSNVGFSDANTGSWMNLQSSVQTLPFSQGGTNGFGSGFHGYGQAAAPAPTPIPQKKVVIIDVAKFIKVLQVTGMCLGRVPGFRRKDVDRALAISSFEAF